MVPNLYPIPKTPVSWSMTPASALTLQHLKRTPTLKWVCSGSASKLSWAAVLTNANGVKLTRTEWVSGFPLTMTLTWQLLTVEHRHLLMTGSNWRTLLTKSMLPPLSEANILVRLFGPLSIGFDAIPKLIFNLPVTTPDNAAPFNLGGLRKSIRLSVLPCTWVVTMNIPRPLIIPVRLSKLWSESG